MTEHASTDRAAEPPVCPACGEREISVALYATEPGESYVNWICGHTWRDAPRPLSERMADLAGYDWHGDAPHE